MLFRSEVIRIQVTVCAEVFDAVRVEEAAGRRVVVAGLQVIPAGLGIVIIRAVADRVFTPEILLPTVRCSFTSRLFAVIGFLV